VSWRDLYALRDVGEIIELSRGLFQLANQNLEHLDFGAVCGRVPDGMICLDSVLADWDCHEVTSVDASHRVVAGGAVRGFHVPRWEVDAVAFPAGHLGEDALVDEAADGFLRGWWCDLELAGDAFGGDAGTVEQRFGQA
jgi:hypothetical protein